MVATAVRERCYNIVRTIPEGQLTHFAMLLEAAQKMIEEALDEAYCVDLYRQAKADPDNTVSISLEDYAKKRGIDLEDAYDED